MYFFQAVLFSIVKANCWPILSNFSYFVRNKRIFGPHIYRPNQCGGVPKSTIIGCDSLFYLHSVCCSCCVHSGYSVDCCEWLLCLQILLCSQLLLCLKLVLCSQGLLCLPWLLCSQLLLCLQKNTVFAVVVVFDNIVVVFYSQWLLCFKILLCLQWLFYLHWLSECMQAGMPEGLTDAFTTTRPTNRGKKEIVQTIIEFIHF